MTAKIISFPQRAASQSLAPRRSTASQPNPSNAFSSEAFSSEQIRILEQCALDEILNAQLDEAAVLLEDWKTYFDRQHTRNLRTLGKSGWEQAVGRDEALMRARQLAGLIARDLLWSLREYVADALEREQTTPAACQVANEIRNLYLPGEKAELLSRHRMTRRRYDQQLV